MSVLKIWQSYGPKIWFNSSIENDKLVCKNLAHLLPHPDDFDFIDDREKLLEAIILTDQVSRHVFRHNTQMIELYGYKAVYYVKQFLIKYKASNKFELLHIGLPLRHFPTEERIQTVMDLYDDYIKRHNHDTEYVQKLRIITTKRYKSWLRKNKNLKADKDGRIYDTEIIDKTCILKNDYLLNIDCFHDDSIFEKFRINFKQYDCVLLSLSGGVDSMVLVLLLLILKKRDIINDFQAFHFNYKIRKESDAEERFLHKFCKINNITLHFGNIDNNDPNILKNWDNATKKQRYMHYRKIVNSMKSKKSQNIPVILGHHLDDVDENVIMNLFNTGSASGNKCLWNEISGMPTNSIVNNVHVYRPFVDTCVRKKWIIDIATKYHIPYFCDSSFELATRIRVRRELLPLMADIFGTSLTSKISKIDKQSKELHTLIKNNIKFHDINHNFMLDLKTLLSNNFTNDMIASSIQDIIKDRLFEVNCNVPSQKSLLNLIEVIKTTNRTKFKVILRDSYYCIFDNNTKLLSFYLP
tara:strand:+ start:4168 stop:5742 length:1575 start_codon:yes stop_codon:yes gene_type:complete